MSQWKFASAEGFHYAGGDEAENRTEGGELALPANSGSAFDAVLPVHRQRTTLLYGHEPEPHFVSRPLDDRRAERPLTLGVWTVGHSTRSLGEFLALLQTHDIRSLADVRRFPGSRRHPHFNGPELQASLGSAGIEYRSLPELGGRRAPRADSPNAAWRNPSFRGYADYMLTDGFREGVQELLAQAARKRTTMMCAEAPWWRCHRALIADYLKANGIEVFHIMDARAPVSHPYTSAASVKDGRLSYE